MIAAYETAAARVVAAQLAGVAPAAPMLERLLAAGSAADLLAFAEPAARVRESVGAVRAAVAGDLGLAAEDLAFRRLYPGLDHGIYACSHSMGVPSVVGPAAVAGHLAEVATRGIGVWDDGLWPEVMDRYRAACAELVGGNLTDGDVTWFPNVSEALHAVLDTFGGGELVFTSGHFTTGHYVHHRWAQNTGGRLVEVPTDADGGVPTGRLLDAVSPSTTVLSISHALFESGWLQDLPALAAGLRSRAPDALLLLDAYQTAGTVPIDAAALGDHVAVTAAGHKQLRSGTGAGFLYLPRRWLRTLTPRRTGWWGHAAPFSFEKGPARHADDGTRFRTGTPTVMAMAMLLGELVALASSAGGSLPAAVVRARRVTSGLVEAMLARAAERDLTVRGAWPAARRGAFVCVEVEDGERVNDGLARMGIRTDFRPRAGRSGWIRVSGNAAGFPYEVRAVIDAIAASPGAR
jgi:kynureninase